MSPARTAAAIAVASAVSYQSTIALLPVPEGAATALTRTFLGADDRIRTRDPHLGNIAPIVQHVCASALTCGSVWRFVRPIHLITPLVSGSTTRSSGFGDVFVVGSNSDTAVPVSPR